MHAEYSTGLTANGNVLHNLPLNVVQIIIINIIRPLIILTEGRHEGVLRLEAPGGGMDARVGVLHPQVVLVRPSVIVDLEDGNRGR